MLVRPGRSVGPEAEWVTGRAGVDSEHLVAVRVVCGTARCLEEPADQSDGLLSCGVDVVDMKVEVDLLLLAANWPLRWDVARGVLNADDPFAIDHNAVPVVIALHCAAGQPGPEVALLVDVVGVEHDDVARIFMMVPPWRSSPTM